MKGVTLSGDATSHCNINYEATHLTYKVASRRPNSAAIYWQHKTRILAIDSTVDHTSETQVDGIKSHLAEVSEVYNQSPLSKRSGLMFDIPSFLERLKGMNGDHANDQKKTVRLVREWKDSVYRMRLGYDAILEMTFAKISEILSEDEAKTVEAMGGQSVWEKMSSDEKRATNGDMMEAVALRLGTEAFERLSEAEKREIDLFFWAGCSMHKELNSVKGANAAMMLWWASHDIPGPILLANKDNDATIRLAEIAETATAAVKRALEVSSCGGVKLTNLAGALFNHKDDKKGLQDMHRHFFQKVKGSSAKFPGTNNTRYQSHCEAAAELITYLPHYIEFLEIVKDKKKERRFNHMEQNIYDALQDPATLTELACLVLYAQTVTHPYMRTVRGSGTEQTNMLTLGPLHTSLKNHIQNLINNPDLVLAKGATFELAALDGKPWYNPKAVDAVLDLAPTLPHLKPLFVAFLEGALTTWERFTTEFETGGAIDMASNAERELAFMPSTNDANEGALGMLRRHARHNPNTTIKNFSDQAAFRRNDTQTFMDLKFRTDDHVYIMREARRLDESGVEKARRQAFLEHNQRVVDEKREKDVVKQKKRDELQARISQVSLVLNREIIAKMTGARLDDQLAVHRQFEKSEKEKKIPLKSHLKTVALKRTALLEAVERYENSETSLEKDLEIIENSDNENLDSGDEL